MDLSKYQWLLSVISWQATTTLQMHKHDHYSRIWNTDLVKGRHNLQFIAIGFVERWSPCLADPTCQLSILSRIFGSERSSHMFGSWIGSWLNRLWCWFILSVVLKNTGRHNGGRVLAHNCGCGFGFVCCPQKRIVNSYVESVLYALAKISGYGERTGGRGTQIQSQQDMFLAHRNTCWWLDPSFDACDSVWRARTKASVEQGAEKALSIPPCCSTPGRTILLWVFVRIDSQAKNARLRILATPPNNTFASR